MSSSVSVDRQVAAPPGTGRLTGVLLEPLDVLFFRDGRPFGAATRGESQSIAWPQTLAGAVWTALLQQQGCDFAELGRRVRTGARSFEEALDGMGLPGWIARVAVRGPWLARVDGRAPTAAPPEVFVPVPAILYRSKADRSDGDRALKRLRPLPPDRSPPGWNKTRSGRHRGLRALWLAELTALERASGWMNLQTLEQFLAGEPVRETDVLGSDRSDELFQFDHRTGIGIQPDQLTSEENLIYSASFLSLRRHDPQGRQIVFYAEIVWPPDAVTDLWKTIATLHLGGEGRRVAVHCLEQPVTWPNAAAAQPGENLLIVLTTPGLFGSGWKPAALADALVAAAVPKAIPVSGWDLARGGPKPARFAVPAGSVFFVAGADKELPELLADDPVDGQQGWGCYVAGTWTE